MARILYLTYDGLAEPLGQSQVLAYLERLSGEHEIHVLSFEKRADRENSARMADIQARCDVAGISWTPLDYHKTPSLPATLYDVAQGTRHALSIAEQWRPDILHCRSYLPALMALPAKRVTGARFLFDIRGFWADERVDGGIWPEDGTLFRSVKSLEKRLFAAADHIVTLTEASLPLIRKLIGEGSTPVSVIPTCVDTERFAPLEKTPAGPFTFGYVGSFGTWYMLDDTMRLFAAIRREIEDARLLVVNRNEHALVADAAHRAGLDPDVVDVVAAEHREVPAHIQRMHAAAALVRPSFSKISSSPTKIGEYLACGVPCVGTSGVGDVETVLEGNNLGIALPAFDDATLGNAARRIIALAYDGDVRRQCRAFVEENYALEHGVALYRAAYSSLVPAM